ncbi:Fe-S cluster assembly protein SufD [Allopseudospirillum japonicum]|uniref:Fe-S cluster assembly protein SufD n=1 Tax=Allopseudospirillum japonicum TaxID=64971 RepID=A0A1H6QRZ4_9GAMM|nr:Fe-S cluster assembly protein SufD [Allopseudospirillum japonicum]SEI42260.1 Fe-S cluster assembly protein SufD [Allopseudospirillum japonicum]
MNQIERLGDLPSLLADPQQQAKLTPQQAQAAQEFCRLGWPTTRDENWKYADLKALLKQGFQWDPSLVKLEDTQLEAAWLPLATAAIRLVFVNGVFAPEHSQQTAHAQVSYQVTTPAEHPLTAAYPAQVAQDKKANAQAAFCALNQALGKTQLQLKVQGCLDTPIYLVYLSTQASEQAYLSLSQLKVEVASGAQATLIEHHLSLGSPNNCSHRQAQIQLDAGAQLKHYYIQELANTDQHLSQLDVYQTRDSHFTSQHINLGGKWVRHDLDVVLAEPGAHVELDGLFFAAGRQFIDTHTRINHAAGHTYSQENYKGILNAKAQGVFNGRVLVQPQSQKIEAHQNNANLLLADGAQINTKPELEIYADDVKCSHGATTGRLNEEAVFALRSRGIDETQARGLLTLAFANEILDNIEILAIHQRIEEAIAGRLPAAYNLKGVL